MIACMLGHRSIKNTLIYVQLGEALFKNEDKEFTCKVARTIEEAKTLIEAGFSHVCEFKGTKMFKKENEKSGPGVSKSGPGEI